MSRALLLGLLAPLCLLCEPAAASEKDPWFGPDKALHFGVSVALSASGYAASSPWLHSRTSRAEVGAAFSLTLGAAKELWDFAGHGDPSWRDLTWDALGTAVGIALSVGVDSQLGRKRNDVSAEPATQGLVFHF